MLIPALVIKNRRLENTGPTKLVQVLRGTVIQPLKKCPAHPSGNSCFSPIIEGFEVFQH